MKDKEVTIIIAGDYHIYGKYKNVNGKFDVFIRSHPNHDLFDEELIDQISNSDLSVFNLENPISAERKGISKFGPHGVGSKESISPIQKAGFNIATFATNHTFDMGNEGVTNTIIECKKSNIEVIGAGLTKEDARKILYKQINNITIAFLNYSRVEYNAASNYHGGANPLDTIENTRDILEAKRNAEFVFVVIHEGLDMYPLPYPELVKQMHFYADMGADAIILHHSRVISGYEIYNGTPIFYGIGNILHLTDNRIEHEGLFIKFCISSDKQLSFEIIPVVLDKNKIKVSIAYGKDADEIYNRIDKWSEIIKNNTTLENEWHKFVLSKRELYISLVLGYPHIIYRIARKFKILRYYYMLMIISKKKYYSKLNLLRCAAHYESTKKALTGLLEEANQ